MKKNSKGFTLIELLAVIVVLAIIMVIATTQVNKAIKGARKDSFVQTAKMVVKETQNRIIAGQMGNSEYKVETGYVTDKYDLSKSDYVLYIEYNKDTGNYAISLRTVDGGKFSSVDSFSNDDCEIKNAQCGKEKLSTGGILTNGPYVKVTLDSNGNIITTTKQGS